ncbi:MAG: hypothetical protein ACFFKA_09630, partial [Candidatus Thorarchaeota archaeon]
EIWKVNLTYNNNQKEKLELFDAKSYFNGYLNIKRTYFNKLVETIKITKKYNVIHGIQEVIGPDEEDWTLNAWMLLIITDDEKQNPFLLFIKRERDLSGTLVAIGPQAFAEYNDNNQDEAKHEIKRLINYLVTYLNKFHCNIFLPNI